MYSFYVISQWQHLYVMWVVPLHTGVDSPGSTVIRAPGYEGNTKVCAICCWLSWKCLFWEILVGMCLQFLCWVTSLLAGSYTGRKGPIVLSPGRHCSGFWRRSLSSAAKPGYSTASSLFQGWLNLGVTSQWQETSPYNLICMVCVSPEPWSSVHHVSCLLCVS